jgi:hypothetical protein
MCEAFAQYLLTTTEDEYIAIENEGLIPSASKAVIKTRPTFIANRDGKYRDLNHGVSVGKLATSPDIPNCVDIVIYRLR